MLQASETPPGAPPGELTLLDLDENSLSRIAESLSARSDLGTLRLVCRDLRGAVASAGITLLISKASMDRLPALSALFPAVTGLDFYMPMPAERLRALRDIFPRLRRLSMAGLLERDEAAEAAAEILLFTGLERLALMGWSRLRELPAGISALTRLRELTFSEWDRPDGWATRKSLMALPEGLSCLMALEILNLEGQRSLTALPEGISCLQRLRELDLTYCRALEVLPARITALRVLEVLRLGGSGILDLPSDIGRLSALHTLVVSGLAEVPASLSTLAALRSLTWTRCRFVQQFVGSSLFSLGGPICYQACIMTNV